jgi:hypothetical protein
MALSQALFGAAAAWSLYIAIEPYIRRHWPDALISWARVQTGRIRDPLVASHILAGCAVLGVTMVLADTLRLTATHNGSPLSVGQNTIGMLDSTSSFVAGLMGATVTFSLTAIMSLLIVFVLRLLVRRLWIAGVLGAILLGVGYLAGPGSLYGRMLLGLADALAFYAIVWIIEHFGLLAGAASYVLAAIAYSVPPAFPSWYAGRGIVAIAIPATVYAWALWVILSDKRGPPTEFVA